MIGLGVTGLSTAGALAHRGHRVVGIDRWGIGHPVTSSTGASRSIRLAYDDERYVRLARAAFEGWHRLEASQDVTLLLETGQVDLGPDAKLEALAGAMRAAMLRSTSSMRPTFAVTSRSSLSSPANVACSTPTRARCSPTPRCGR